MAFSPTSPVPFFALSSELKNPRGERQMTWQRGVKKCLGDFDIVGASCPRDWASKRLTEDSEGYGSRLPTVVIPLSRSAQSELAFEQFGFFDLCAGFCGVIPPFLSDSFTDQFVYSLFPLDYVIWCETQQPMRLTLVSNVERWC